MSFCRSLSQRSSQKTSLSQKTVFCLTPSPLAILLKVHLSLLRVSSSRLPLACPPSNLSLSLHDQMTPPSNQGIFFVCVSVNVLRYRI